MKLKRFIRHIAISVNPTKYKQVIEKSFGQTLGLYFFVWVISLIILLVVGLVQFNAFKLAMENLGTELIDGTMISFISVPGLVLIVGLIIFIVSHLITLLSAIIIKVSIKKGVSFRDAWVLCLHAILVPFLLFIIFLPFAKVFWLFVILFFFYAIFVAIGTSLVVGKQFKSMNESTTFK